MSSQTTSLTPKKKQLKGGESRNQEIPVFPIFVGYALVFCKKSYTSEEECISKVLHGVALVNYNKHDSIIADSLHSRVMFCIQKVFRSPLKTSLYFASLAISRCMLSFADKTMEGILFHLFYLFFHNAFGQQNNENNNICTICISFAIVQS